MASSGRARRASRRGAVGVDADVCCGGPFADESWHDGVCGAERLGPGTGLGDVLGLGEGVVGVCEKLVEMRVDAELAVGIKVLGDAGPGWSALEGVVHDDDEVWVCGCGFDGCEGGFGPSLGCAEEVVAPGDGLVDELKSDDDVGVLEGAVFSGHGFENGDGAGEVLGLLPVDGAGAAGVVEAVLAAR